MIQTVNWHGHKVVHKSPDYMITYKSGTVTRGCQCYSDCSCAEDNAIKGIQLYRVSGKSRKDFIPKPFDFDNVKEAFDRIKELRDAKNSTQEIDNMQDSNSPRKK